MLQLGGSALNQEATLVDTTPQMVGLRQWGKLLGKFGLIALPNGRYAK